MSTPDNPQASHIHIVSDARTQNLKDEKSVDIGLIQAATSVSPLRSATVSHIISKIMRKMAPIATHMLFGVGLFLRDIMLNFYC